MKSTVTCIRFFGRYRVQSRAMPSIFYLIDTNCDVFLWAFVFIATSIANLKHSHNYYFYG